MRTALRYALVIIVVRLLLGTLFHATEGFLLQLLDFASKTIAVFESHTSSF